MTNRSEAAIDTALATSPPGQPDGDGEVFALPASTAQQRLWFLDRFSMAGAAYNVFAAFEISGAFSPSILERSLNVVVARHESLRTTFKAVGGTVTQIITPSLTVSAEVEIVADDATTLSRILVDEVSRPFDLSSGPLVRAKIYKRGAERHVFLIVGHHIVLDGWSMQLLLEELAQSYGAFASGSVPTLRALPVQYADYAVWEQQALQSNAHEEGLAFWRQYLAGELVPLNLPKDRPRPPEASYRGQTLPFQISAALTERLSGLARAESGSFFVAVLAAFAVLLHRYSGQEEILIGSPIANRLRPEIEPCIGFFANSVVFRCDLSGRPTFREVLRRCRTTALQVYAHQGTPFDHVVRAISPDRIQNQNPLFQVMLAAQRMPDSLLPLQGLEVAPVFIDNGTSKFDMLMELQERPTGTDARLEFSTDLFETSTVARLVRHLLNLLAAVAASPDTGVDEIELMDAAEREIVVRNWNATATEYPDAQLLHTMIEAQAARSPEAVAVECEGQYLTYGELDRRANQLAHRLRAFGVGPDVLVGIHLERSLPLVVALYATLKAGGAYVPMDPEYPAERLAFMLADADAPVLITTGALAGRLPSGGAATLLIDEEWNRLDAAPATKPDVSVAPDGLAYMIYTSGSTGRPKGALNTHRGIRNRLAWMRDQYGVGPATVILQKTPISFDVSVWELFLPLLTGARMVLARPGGHRDPDYLVDLIERRGVTMLHFVPSMLRVFLEQPGVEGCRPLKHVICSGEALPSELRSAFFERLSCSLHNLYGPTEAAVDVTFWDCRQASETPTVPIGRPVANTQIYILDERLRPTPVGVPGELYIGGVQVGRGYHKRPELTAERFIRDPFALDDPAARLYKTGDLCRFLPDGAIDYLGRLDQQVKMRGFRIELGEIETTLNAHPAVQEAVVTAVDDSAQGKRLVAHVVADPTVQFSQSAESVDVASEQVSQWLTVWDQIYGSRPTSSDRALNIIGWNSSYTRAPFSEDEMREWVEATAGRIRSLNPRRVWEIGCGSGLILFRIAPGCEAYLGTDYSETGVAHLRQTVGHDLPQVRLVCCPAHQPPPDTARKFDTVVINSVAQYFPSVDYLLQVLDTAVEAVRDGGTVFLGDIRNLALLEAFHASVQLHQAPDSLTTAELRDRVRRAASQDQELVLAPALFDALPRRIPRISRVGVHVKRGRHRNELTKFRYDVVLFVGQASESTVDRRNEIKWSEPAGLETLRGHMRVNAGAMTAVRNVTNDRVAADVRLTELLRSADAPRTAGELRQALRTSGTNGVDPEDAWGLESELPCQVEISWAATGRADALDIAFGPKAGSAPRLDAASASRPREATAPPDARFWRAAANNPLQVSFARRLVPLLRAFAQERLPDYMVPSAFVCLERMPLSPNGKIDRRALPAPDPPVTDASPSAPRDAIEERLVLMWAELLGLRTVGLRDSFFDIGGHSLLAAKLIAQVNKSFGKRIPLAALFESNTVELLARLVRGDRVHEADRCLVVLSREGAAPPLIFVHPLGGSVDEYLPLARRLAPHQPFIGVHAPLENGVPDWADSIERMAQRYVDELCRFQPRGPIFIGGWSGGATVALEMAQQLRARGRDVPLVIALDASPYHTGTGTPRWSPVFAWKIARNLPRWIHDDLIVSGGADLGSRIRRKLAAIAKKATTLTRGEQAFATEVEGFFDLSRMPVSYREFMKRYYMALRKYVPKPYPGPVLLFKARTQPLYHLIEPELAWPVITEHLEIKVLPCTHLSIVEEPHVHALADYVKARIAALGC